MDNTWAVAIADASYAKGREVRHAFLLERVSLPTQRGALAAGGCCTELGRENLTSVL